jgi:RND family efflux transporter MFP subunit
MANGTNSPGRRRLVVLGLVALFVAALVAVAMLNRTLSTGEKLSGDIERDIWPVNVATVVPTAFVERIEQSGVLQPMEEANLNAEVSARVLAIRADLGDRVKKGQALVILDASAYQLAYDSAKAQRADTAVMAKLYREQYERAQKLAKQGHISQEELDMARSNAGSFAAKVDLAEAGYAAAARNRRETTIRAPFAGRVSARHASLGELVAPGTPVLTVVKDDVLKIDLDLAETDIGRVRIGLEAVVEVPSVGREFAGTVTRIGAAANRASGAFPARVEIDNRNGGLLAGMRCNVAVELERVPEAIVVTRDEVVTKGEEQVVFVAESDAEGWRAVQRPVTLGNRDGQSVRVLTGLGEGDLLIVVGQNSVKDGSRLTLVERDGERVVQPPAEAAVPTEG